MSQDDAHSAGGSIERRWKSIVENPFDFVVVVDCDYKYLYVNHTAPGIELEDLIGKATPFDFVEEAQQGPMRAALDKARAEGVATSYDVYVEPLDQWFSNIVGPIKENGRVIELSILTRDITEAKRAELELERSERRLRLALEGSNTGLFDMNVATGNAYYSPTFYHLLCYDDGDPQLVPHLDEFRRRLHPEDCEDALRTLQRALAHGEVFDHEYRMRTASGEYRWFSGRGTLMEIGGQTRFMGILSDITERRKHAEERALLEAQLWHAQKTETVGALAGGIAHDVNNALSPVLGFGDVALYELGPDHPVRPLVESMVQGAQRAREIVKQVLLFGRRAPETNELLDLGETVREALRLVESSLPASVELSLERPDHGPWVFADATQIHQVVANLCTNAYQAMESGSGKLTVRVDEAEFATSQSLQGGALLPGRYAVIHVADTGVGIAPALLAQVLEPFFTTKKVGEGTGLGLSVVHGIALRHRGGVDVESTPSRGSHFRVYFPLQADANASAALPLSTLPPERVHRQRILVVDDDPSVAAVQASMLETLGHTVRVVHSGEDALAVLKGEHDAVDAILTDYAMGGMNGGELAKKIRAAGLRQPILMVTGYMDRAASTSNGSGIDGILSKPFTMAELEEAMARLLAKTRS